MKSLEDFGFKRNLSKNQLPKKPSTFRRKNSMEFCNDYSHDPVVCIPQQQKSLEDFGFKRIPPNKKDYLRFLQMRYLKVTDFTWDLYKNLAFKNGSAPLGIYMDYTVAQAYLDVVKPHEINEYNIFNKLSNKVSKPRPRKRWKIVRGHLLDYYHYGMRGTLYYTKKSRCRNYRRNKRRIQSLCDFSSSTGDFKLIDIDPPLLSELQAEIAYIRYNNTRGSRTISNGSIFVIIPKTFWIDKLINTWASAKPTLNESYRTSVEQNIKERIYFLEAFISSLKFIYNKLLEGSVIDAKLMQQALMRVEMYSDRLPPKLRALKPWISTWANNPWSLHVEEFNTLYANIKLYWREEYRAAHSTNSPQRYTFQEVLEELKSISFKLHSLIIYLEERNYYLMLNNWNNKDIHLVMSPNCTPTTSDIQAAQLILEASLKHLLHALSHVNRVFGKRELKQSMATATQQYNLLQHHVNSNGLFEFYYLICCNLCVCQSSQTFTDMDLIVDILSSPWLTKIWSRAKAIFVYSSDSNTDLLARRYEKEEYQLSLSAVSYAESLPNVRNQNLHAKCFFPIIRKSVYRESNLAHNQHPSKVILYNLPLQPYHLLLPTPTYKSKAKLPNSLLTHCWKYGPFSVIPPDGKLPYLIPVLPYRRSDNRAGIG